MKKLYTALSLSMTFLLVQYFSRDNGPLQFQNRVPASEITRASGLCEMAHTAADQRSPLRGDWHIFSSEDANAEGPTISSGHFNLPEFSYKSDRPITVSGLMANTLSFRGKKLAPPFLERNFRSWPGVSD